jgi:hypothetical protein
VNREGLRHRCGPGEDRKERVHEADPDVDATHDQRSRTYDTVLEVVGHRRDAEFFVVSGFGPRSDWLRNLDAAGPAAVTVGRLRFPADHRRLNDAEALAVLAEYERRNRLIRPVVHRALSWLLGWTYRGTDADRRLLVDQLPVIGLQPLRNRETD